MNINEFYIQITSGRGPVECSWVVAKTLIRIIADIKLYNLKSEVICQEDGPEEETLASVTLKVSGLAIKQLVNDWQGTVLWVGESPYRKFHKRRNWYIGVNCIPVTQSDQSYKIDFMFQAFRSGGPGGQHVNKVSSAIRAVHKQTGLTVIASDTRSQIRNKELAIQRLLNLIRMKESESKMKNQKDLWSCHNSLIRGNPTRKFKGLDFEEVMS